MAGDITHLGQLTSDPANARKHNPRNVGLIEQALNEVGAARSIVIDEHGTVLAGNATIEAAAAAGIERVQVVDADGETIIAVRRRNLTPEQKKRLAYFDNRTAELADWNIEQLLEDRDNGLDLAAVGFTDAELAELLAGVDTGTEGLTDPDAVPAVPEVPVTQPGDLWLLGRHRLLCGDSTNATDTARLTDGASVALCVTSPPYGVGKEYESDGIDGWRKLMADLLPMIASVSPLAAINLADVRVGPGHREVHTYGEMVALCDRAGLSLIGTRIWAKPPAWAQGPYWLSSYRAVDDFEYIGIFGTADYIDRTAAEWKYRGVWEITSVVANKQHSASFPVELPSRLIELLCDRDATVYDPFLGSGTTLIAAEQLGRTCYGMEISPAYCDVICRRYFEFTGVEPVRERDGATWSEVAP